MQRLVDEAMRIVRERARARKLDLVAELPDGDLLLIGDERALKQVLLNLLSNAIKFSHEGGRVEIRACGGRDGAVVIEVEDYGIGMSPDEDRPRPAAVRPGEFGDGAKLWRHRARSADRQGARRGASRHAGDRQSAPDAARRCA